MTPESVEFGPASPAEIERLTEIESGNKAGWSREAFASELKNESPSLFVLKAGGRVVGFICIRRTGPEVDIVNVAVDPGSRRHGHGRSLLQSLLGDPAFRGVERVFLEVREGNEAARSLYRGLGFREVQRRPRFYRDPVEDALVLTLDVSHLNA